MKEPAYPAARLAAQRLEPDFERQHRGEANAAPLPGADAIETLTGSAFWASLQRVEGYSPKISLAYLPPSATGVSLVFERPLSLSADALARLSPAVEGPGIHLGVWREQDDYYIWGTTRSLPASCFVVEVVTPGLLVIKRSRGPEAVKFVNVAVLEGDRIKVLDYAAKLPGCQPAMASLLNFSGPNSPVESTVLTELAISMRAHGRGGSLLVVPAGTEAWRNSIVHPIQYSVSPPFVELAELVRNHRGEPWGLRGQLRPAVDALAALTAVDGATVITDGYELLAFGAKIARRDGWPRIDQVLVTEPVEGAVAEVIHPAQLGGTRHMSGAQFAQDQRDAVALVASQDRHFTIFAWSSSEEMVHAHRVEALLL